MTALGAVLVGLLESFASFLSSAVQGSDRVLRSCIPVLLWRSYSLVHAEEEDEE